MNEVTFMADSVKIYGPSRDGSMNVTLTIGEYEKDKLKKILDFKKKHVISVALIEVTPEAAKQASEAVSEGNEEDEFHGDGNFGKTKE